MLMGTKINLVGRTYGRFTVIREGGRTNHGNVKWVCKCSCGNIVEVAGGSLRNGLTKSCGCYQKDMASKSHVKNLIGKRFGKLEVISECGRTNAQKTTWLCKCDCGNLTKAIGSDLISGQKKSCGCLRHDHSGENSVFWKGGKSFEPYCVKFNLKTKERVRNKYGRKCFICGKNEDENGKKLEVHHVDYNKEQGCNGHKWALVPLCRSCHSKTNHNRTAWQMIIKHKLAYIENGGEL